MNVRWIGPWRILLMLLGTTLGAGSLGAQEGGAPARAEVNLLFGAFVPLSESPLQDNQGDWSLSRSVVLGLAVKRPMSDHLAIGGSVRIGPTKGVPRLTGALCDEHRDSADVGRDCRWTGGPMGPIAFGHLELVALLRPVEVGLGFGARYLGVGSGDCQLIDVGCLAGQQTEARAGWKGAVLVSVGFERHWFGQALRFGVADAMSRYEGRVEHELMATIGFRVYAGSPVGLPAEARSRSAER